MAFAQKYRGDGKITQVFLGEGAAQQGAVHEAMNLAGLWRLPIVFILENNQYGMGTSQERSSATRTLYQRAAAYNFPGVECNGMDVLAVRDVLAEAVQRARRENTPTLVEAHTYRFRGHSMSDPALYRTADEVEQHKREDPILLLRSALLQQHAAQADLDELDVQARAEMKQAVEFAQSSPAPELSDLARDVYARPWDESLLP